MSVFFKGMILSRVLLPNRWPHTHYYIGFLNFIEDMKSGGSGEMRVGSGSVGEEVGSGCDKKKKDLA